MATVLSELVYSGQRLRDDDDLVTYGVKPGVTVHVLKKAVADDQQQIPKPMDKAAVQQVVIALQTALMNPAYRSIVSAY